jgi:plasmid stabilization system protein ParE
MKLTVSVGFLKLRDFTMGSRPLSTTLCERTIGPGVCHASGLGMTQATSRPQEVTDLPRQEWTDKQERKYEHIRDSEKQQGVSTKRAKEIAARTVNKERAQKGQTKTASRSSTRDMSSSRRGGLRSGTSRPKGRTKAQLYNEAKSMGIKGRSKMNKEQLQRAVDRKKS